MTLGDLREIVKGLPDELKLVYLKDPRGGAFSEIYNIRVGMYRPQVGGFFDREDYGPDSVDICELRLGGNSLWATCAS